MELQQEDKVIQRLLKGSNAKNKSQFIEADGLIYRTKLSSQDGQTKKKLIIPEKLKYKVIEMAHDFKMSGHLGIKKTQSRIAAVFYWPRLQEDVKQYCKSCCICQRTIQKGKLPLAPLGKMPIIDEPFRRIAIDIIGPLTPKSEDGHRYILTIIDYATRYPEAVPLREITTESVADALVSVFTRLGLPEEILTD